MARTTDENHVEILSLDHAVEVNIDEVEPRGGTPMSQEPGLDVF
jgi:hypothetical protein